MSVSWDEDPMKHDFLAPDNRYPHLNESQQLARRVNGPGAEQGDDLQAARPYELVVTNIPENLTKQGIWNLFSKCGRVINVDERKTARDRRFAFVSFADFMSSQMAINKYHGTEPFHLQVRNKMLDSERGKIREGKRTVSQYAVDVEKRFREFQRTGGVGMAELPNTVRTSARGRGVALTNVAESFSVARRPLTFHQLPQHLAMSYSSGTATEDNEENDTDGLSGFKKRPLVLIDPVTLQTKVVGVPLVLPYSTPFSCSYCAKEGRLRCSLCKTWYCSRFCQENDWSAHRPNCVPVPTLEHHDGTSYRQPLRHPRTAGDGDRAKASVQSNARGQTQKQHGVDHSSDLNGVPASSRDDQQVVAEVSKENLRDNHQVAPKTGEEDPKDNTQLVPKAAEEDPKENTQLVPKTSGQEPKENELAPAQEQPGPVENKPAGEKPVAIKTATDEVNKDVVATGCIDVNTHDAPTTQEQHKATEKLTSKDWQKSVLGYLAPGEEAAFLLSNEENPISDDCSFVATSTFNTNELRYILETLDEEYKALTSSLVTVKPGDFVVAKSTKNHWYQRGVVLATKGNLANVLKLDFGTTEKLRMEDLYPVSSHECHSIPGMAVLVEPSGGTPSPELIQVVRRLADKTEFVFNFKVVGKSERPLSVQAVLLDTYGKELLAFDLLPWTAVDTRVPGLLGWPVLTVKAADLGYSPLSEGDKVFPLDWSERSDMMALVKMADVEKSAELETILHKELSKRKIPVSNPRRHEVVVCYAAEAESFYRAKIMSLDLGRKKAKVLLVDYGNASIESLSNLWQLPESAANKDKFPMLAHVVKLSMVSSFDVTDPDVKIKLKHVKPLLEVPCVIRFKDNSSDPLVAILEHPNGKTINEITQEKLQPHREPGDMQGKVLGGGFEYDSCHVCDLHPSAEQDVIVLHAESPHIFFVTPVAQIGPWKTLNEKITSYLSVCGAPPGCLPIRGRVCLAKASDDEWYRGVGMGEAEVEGVMCAKVFFPDYGFQEIVSPANIMQTNDKLMETPFLANQCFLEGFETADEDAEVRRTSEALADSFQKLLPTFAEVKLKTLRKQSAAFVVQIPSIKDEVEKLLKDHKEQDAEIVLEAAVKKKDEEEGRNVRQLAMRVLRLLFFISLHDFVKSVTGRNDLKKLKKRLVIINVDGFRWDYLSNKPAKTPNLKKFLDEGVRAQYVQPVYPSLSLPSWSTIATGLYPEDHGILSNDFYDRESGESFKLTDVNLPGDKTREKHWWEGQVPLWITAKAKGLSAGAYQWFGCGVPFTEDNLTPDVCIQYDEDDSCETKYFAGNLSLAVSGLAKKGLDLALIYYGRLDMVGHKFGPDSQEVITELETLDRELGKFFQQLQDNGIYEATDIIIVSDHGMTFAGKKDRLFLDDLVNLSLVEWCHSDSSVSLIYLKDKNKAAKVAESAKTASNEKIDAYQKSDIPERLHFKDHKLIPDVLLMAKGPDFNPLMTLRNGTHRDIGSHGYDDTSPDPDGYQEGSCPDMRTIFLARGPSFKSDGSVIPWIKMVDEYQVFAKVLDLDPGQHSGNSTRVQGLFSSSTHVRAILNLVVLLFTLAICI